MDSLETLLPVGEEGDEQFFITSTLLLQLANFYDSLEALKMTKSKVFMGANDRHYHLL